MRYSDSFRTEAEAGAYVAAYYRGLSAAYATKCTISAARFASMARQAESDYRTEAK